ncbi:MAG: hypothetical protein ACTSSE_15860 [Candidatus Thorarchaeota archaeon]
MAIGLPVFLASGIVFGTSSARRHIIALQKSGKSSIEVFLRCLLETYALVLVFSVFVSLALFFEPQLVGTTFYDPLGTGYLIYLLPVLTATFVVAFLLATVGVFLVIVSDNILISTSLGCAVTIGLATAVGWNPQSFNSSLTKGIAMLSPSNIVRIFAGYLSGYDPQRDESLATFFGFAATPVSVLIALVVFGVIVFVCTIASIKILRRTISFWPMLQGKSSEVWDSEPERLGEKKKIKREMKIRRAVLAGSIIILLAVMPFGTASYTSAVLEESTIIFHQSPEDGEQINLGEWYVFSCNVQPPRSGQSNYLRYECLIVDWGNAPAELSFFKASLNMSASEFQLLNETARIDLRSYRNKTQGEFSGFSGGWNLGEAFGNYIFVLKVIATENATLSGFIHCAIKLYQSPSIYMQ